MQKQDAVFGETALRKGYISYSQLKECREIQQKLRDMGLEPKPLRDILTEKNYLSDPQATAILTEIGGQVAGAAPPSGGPRFTEQKPGGDYSLAELALKEGLITFEQMRECLDTQQQIRNLGYDPKPLDRIMIQKGLLNEAQVDALKAGGTRLLKIPPKIDSRIGDVAVQKKYITRAQLDECLQLQAVDREHGRQPQKIGELLVAKGYLTLQQVDELVLISSKSAAPFEIPGYEILGKLGVGGMGAVYKAKQVSIDRVVAIKVLYPKFVKDREYLERFLREARLLAKLQHPNIVAAIDAGEIRGTPYFVMELVDGVSLSTLLDHKGRIPETDCIKLAVHIANALQHAHRHKLVHRDIKPQNVIITRDGLVKVCDLGIAKSTDGAGEAGLTTHGMAVGTPFYMSPEACMGRDVDIRADIYSLGATLYHLATGTPPFDAPAPASILAMHVNQPLESPQRRYAALSGEFAACIVKMMEKAPSNRPQTPAEVARIFESLLKSKKRIVDGIPVGDTGVLRVRRPVRTARAEGGSSLPPTGTLLAVLVFLAAGLAAAVYLLRDPGTSGPRPAAGIPASPPRGDSPATRPTGAPPPPETTAAPDVYRPLHESKLDELKRLRSSGRPDPTVDEFLEPYDFMVACLGLFQGTPYRAAWIERIAEFEREANERASDLWDQVRLKVEGHVELGETRKALELLESFPEFRRFAGRNILTEAERERTRLRARLQSQAGVTFDAYSVRIRDALARGDLSAAWRDALEVTISAGQEKTLDIRLAVLRAHAERLGHAPLTAPRLAQAAATLGGLRHDYPGDDAFVRAVDDAVASLQAAHDRALAAARERLSGGQADALARELDGLLASRDYEAAGRRLAALLEDPELGPALAAPAVDVPKLSAALALPARADPAPLAAAAAMCADALAVSPSDPAAPLLVRAWALAQLRALWWQGCRTLLAPATDRSLALISTLDHPLLKGATRITARLAESPGLSLEVASARGRQEFAGVVALFPRSPKALGEEDLLKLAKLAPGGPGPDHELRAALACHYAGDAKRAASWAAKIPAAALPAPPPLRAAIELIRKPPSTEDK
jgi:hypothetical protein